MNFQLYKKEKLFLFDVIVGIIGLFLIIISYFKNFSLEVNLLIAIFAIISIRNVLSYIGDDCK